jgi:hypothetical protein
MVVEVIRMPCIISLEWMDSVANRKRFIVGYPAGTHKSGLFDRNLFWNDGRPF